jgi:hypothetical protein
MVGNQEGTQNDFGIAFREATSPLRLLAFLGVGVGAFLVLTFWSLIAPYVRHPGAAPVAAGLVVVFAGMTLTKWYDPVGKLGPVSTAVGQSKGVPFLVSLYFSWFAWALFLACLVLGGVAVATRRPVVGSIQIGVGLVAAILVFIAHAQLVTFAGGIDHTLGVYLAVVGYLVYAGGGLIAARSHAEAADPMRSIERALAWRPGLPLAIVGLLIGVNSYVNTAWFSPLQLDVGFAGTRDHFPG